MTESREKRTGAPARAARALRSLAMAGQALDPNACGGPDLRLGRVLLVHALVEIGAAVDGDAGTVSAALAALEGGGYLARLARRPESARSMLERLGDDRAPEPGAESLLEAEALLGEVARAVRDDPAISRARRRGRAAFALFAAAAVAAAMVPTLSRSGPWQKFRWTSSSAVPGYETSGVLGARESHGLLFHTNREPRPWVSIDLLEVRPIHLVTVTNRSDCCDERCLPLVVEAAGEDGRFVEVARRTQPFAVWSAKFPERSARYVRLWVDGTTFFHLQEIEIH